MNLPNQNNLLLSQFTIAFSFHVTDPFHSLFVWFNTVHTNFQIFEGQI